MNKVIIYIFSLLLSYCVFVAARAQDTPEAPQVFEIRPKQIVLDSTQLNRYDDEGRRYGLWCEANDSVTSLIWYTKGFRNGLGRYYRHTDGRTYLWKWCNYQYDSPAGFYVLFDERMMVRREIVKIKDNLSHPRRLDAHPDIDFKYQGYEYVFGPTGQLVGQGEIIFGDDIENSIVRVDDWL